jgi:hypothetical protein
MKAIFKSGWITTKPGQELQLTPEQQILADGITTELKSRRLQERVEREKALAP